MKLKTLAAATTVAAASIAGSGFAGTASAEPTWAPAATADVHPGTQTYTEGGQCTANYVFTDSAGGVYIGQAAHCSGLGAATDTNGCDSGSLPIGTKVEVDGASQPGTMVYNSWLTMQDVGETDENTCAYNDFALIKLDPADHAKVNPSIPFWGGPNGISTGTAFGEQVYTFGNSSLRLGIEVLSPKTGVSLGTSGDGWTHPLYTVSPGIPGDSGSPFLDSQGRALGVLSTLAIAPLAGSNNVSDIGLALQYMEANTSIDVTLANGTETFSGLG